MKLFKLLQITTIVLSSLLADDTFVSQNQQEKTNKWNYFGEFKTYISNIDQVSEKTTNYHEVMNYNSIQLHTDYLNNNFYFSMTPYAYAYTTKSHNELKGSNYSDTFKFQDFIFRSLYVSYSIDKLTVGLGILPLSNSFPMQYSSDYYQDGEGISVISDLDPLAIFIKYRFNDTNKILIGAGILDTDTIPTGMYVNKHNLENSYGLWITQTILKDKIKIINDFKYTDVFYDGIQTGEFYNAGTGISYDDSEYSGWSIYNVLAFSLYQNNSIATKEQILSNMDLSDIPLGFESSFSFDNKDYFGAANLFGFRKDLDIFNFETFINFEWFRVFKDWTSANKGALYKSNSTQLSNTRDDSYFINYGFRISELSTITINYSHIEFDEIENIGAPSSTPVAESFGTQRSSANILKLSFVYKF